MLCDDMLYYIMSFITRHRQRSSISIPAPFMAFYVYVFLKRSNRTFLFIPIDFSSIPSTTHNLSLPSVILYRRTASTTLPSEP